MKVIDGKYCFSLKEMNALNEVLFSARTILMAVDSFGEEGAIMDLRRGVATLDEVTKEDKYGGR